MSPLELSIQLRYNHIKDITDSTIHRSHSAYSRSKVRYDIYSGLLETAFITHPLKNPEPFFFEANQSSNIHTTDIVFAHARLTHLLYLQHQILRITEPATGPQTGQVLLPDYQSTPNYHHFASPRLVSLEPEELDNIARSAQAFAVSDLLTAFSLLEHTALALFPLTKVPASARNIDGSPYHFHLPTNTSQILLCLDYTDPKSSPVALIKIFPPHPNPDDQIND